MDIPVRIDLQKGEVELKVKIKLNLTDMRGYAFMQDHRLVPHIERAVLDGLSTALNIFAAQAKQHRVLVKLKGDGEDEKA